VFLVPCSLFFPKKKPSCKHRKAFTFKTTD
jgi:hypothetical protein